MDSHRHRARKDRFAFQATIAHGFLTLSLLPHLAAQAFTVRGNWKMGINYGLNRLRFISPVQSGSRVRARFTLQAVEEFRAARRSPGLSPLKPKAAKSPR